MSITIHGVQASPFVRKVRVGLAEKGLDYELNPVVPFGMPDDVAAISPLKKIPVLQEGDFTLPDSSVILQYLERKQPKPSLYPEEAQAFARALWFEEYADTKLSGAVGTVFFQRFVRPTFFKQDTDEELVQKALAEELPPVFDYLEKELGDQEYLVGRFSVADIATGSMFQNFALGGEHVDGARWPKLAAYVQNVHARPSFKACIEEEKALTAG